MEASSDWIERQRYQKPRNGGLLELLYLKMLSKLRLHLCRFDEISIRRSPELPSGGCMLIPAYT